MVDDEIRQTEAKMGERAHPAAAGTRAGQDFDWNMSNYETHTSE